MPISLKRQPKKPIKSITNDKIKILISEIQRMYPQAESELQFENPYQCLVAVMLSAQTTDKQVNKITTNLFQQLKSPFDIKWISLDEITKKIKSINYYKNKAKYLRQLSYQLIKINQEKKEKNLTSQEKEQKTTFWFFIPEEESELIKLSWIGIKTAKVIEAIIFQKPTIAVDTHVHRVLNRIGIVKTKTPQETSQIINKIFPENLKKDANNLLVLFWRYHCKAKNPQCNECNFKEICNFYQTTPLK